MAHDFKRFPELTNSQMQFYYFDSPHKQITEGFLAKVIRIIDGDTIRVKWDERNFDFPVRLLKIDAPELDEGGLESALWLKNEILGEEVYVTIDRKQRVEKWGRILGEIIHMGRNINQLSLEMGHSIPFGNEQ